MEYKLEGSYRSPACCARSEAPGCVARGWRRWPSDPRRAATGRSRRRSESKSDGRGTQRSIWSSQQKTLETSSVAPCPAHLSGPRAVESSRRNIADSNITVGQGSDVPWRSGCSSSPVSMGSSRGRIQVVVEGVRRQPAASTPAGTEGPSEVTTLGGLVVIGSDGV